MTRATKPSWTPVAASLTIHALAIALIWAAIHRLELGPAGTPSEGLALNWARTRAAGPKSAAPVPRANHVFPAEPAAEVPREAFQTVPTILGTAASGASAGSTSKTGRNLPVGPEFAVYLMQIRSKIERSIEYPLSLRRRGVTGVVQLVLLIDPQGALKSVQIAESSGTPDLDQLAVDAARRSSPFPRVGSGDLKLKLPVQFKIL